MKRTERFLLVLFALLLSNSLLFAQVKRTITGVVTDNTGKPVPSATVSVAGTTMAATTDENGRYSITVDKANAVLVFSSISFGTKEVAVGSGNTLDVNLDLAATDLGEVVVTTALGIKRQKKSLGYAVQEVRGAVLADARETNLANALSGKVAGLQVIRSSNGAGGSSKIVLRGNNSLTGSNQPLIVVDGIPIDNFTGTTENGYWSTGYDRGNGLGDISADDIESMQILKGPSAAALYGARAGNGVIQITTKTGRKQAGLGLTLTSNMGVESIFLQPKLQNNYGQGLNGTYNPRATSSWGPKAEGQSVTRWDGSTGPMKVYDNVDNFLRAGTTQNYGLSFQQQVGSTSVYASLNRWDDKSILPGNKLERTNLTSRIVSKFGKDNRWTIDVKAQYNKTSGFNRPINGRDNSSVFVLYMLPRSLDIRDFSAAADEDGNMIWYDGSNAVNPYWRARYDKNQDVRDRIVLNGSIKYAFTDWLNWEVKAGGDIYSTNTQRKLYSGSPNPFTGSYSQGKETFSETNMSTMLTAQKDNLFGGKFGGTATLGGNLMSQEASSLGASVGVLVVPNLFSLKNGVNNPSVTEFISERKMNSLFGSVGINYDGYLFLDATFRNDWTSTLIKANRSFFYPSVSLSAVLTEMLEKSGTRVPAWWSYGKLRASYAQVGNDMAPYQLYNFYRIDKDPNGNTTAARHNVLLDPNVRNELIKSVEVGAELRFFNNRFGLDFSWYKSNATNQLIDLQMDPQSGYEKRKINAGNIQNSGVEIMADARIINNSNGLNWTVIANFSANRNKIIDISKSNGVNEYPLGTFDNLFIRATSGSLYGDFYGTRFLRVSDENDPNYGKLLLTSQGLPQHDPAIVKLGNQQAKAMVGVNNSFSYKNFSFSFLVDARIGGKIFSGSQVALQSSGAAAVTVKDGKREDFVVDGVMLDGTGGYVKNTLSVSPQLYWSAVSSSGGNLGIGEAYLYDATNIRLRNIQVGYELPRKMLSKTPLQRARFSLSCNNVWMIKSHMDGIDPESVFATGTNAVGFEAGAPPTMRSILFSLTLGF